MKRRVNFVKGVGLLLVLSFIIVGSFAFTSQIALAEPALEEMAELAENTSVEEILLEMQEEHRFWELRRELHRIHHNTEYILHGFIGIIIMLFALVVVQFMALKKK